MNEPHDPPPASEPITAGQNMLDGGAGEGLAVAPEIAAVASDLQADLDERLEAYEDIVDSEVGDTSLSRARHFERENGLRQVFLKFEGGNPTGTQKDRIAFAQAMDALRRGFDTITVATCGNFGAALAVAARLAGLRCLIFIPEGYHTRRSHDMAGHGAEIVRIGSGTRSMATSPSMPCARPAVGPTTSRIG